MGLESTQYGVPNLAQPPYLKRYYVDISAGDYTLFNNNYNYAQAVADAAGNTLYFPAGVYNVFADFTVPANTRIELAPGALLVVSSGVTVSILGPVTCALRQWISGLGTVAFGPNSALGGLRPQWWGALANGVNDDSAAIRKCFLAARAQAGGASPFAIPAVDFGGLVYGIGAQVEIPGGYGLILHSGTFVTVAGFTSGMYMFATGSVLDASLPDGFKINNLHLRDLYFDNKHVGGGFLCQRYNRVKVDSCSFTGYSTQGIRTAVDGHELAITLCQIGEYFWGDATGTGYNHPDQFVGTGIRFETNDNSVTDTIIQLSLFGIYCANADANTFSGVHIWPGYVAAAGPSMSWVNTCVYVDSASILNFFTNCYFDGGLVIWENPWKSGITSSIFLNGQGDAARAMITFKAVGAGIFIDGFVITGNSFVVTGGGTMLGLKADTSGGTFSGGNISRVRWADNGFSSVTSFYSHWRGQLSVSGGNQWVFDMTTKFPIGAPFVVLWSAYSWGGGTQLFRHTGLAGQVVTIGSYDSAIPANLSNCNATVNVEISISKSDP
jgi:hypothetical protein